MMLSSHRIQSVQAIRKALVAGYPVIGIDTLEEDQVDLALMTLFKSAFPGDGAVFYQWDLQFGLTDKGIPIEHTQDLNGALDYLFSVAEPGFFVFKDAFFACSRPEIQRRLQNFHLKFRGQNHFLFLIGRDVILLPELRKEIHLLRFGFPEIQEIQEIIERNIAQVVKRGAENQLTPEETAHCAVSLQGFTAVEAQQILNKLLWNRKVIDGEFTHQLLAEKELLTRQEGVLEFIRTECSIDQVGGLKNLKDWLIKRKSLYSPEAASRGISPPKGLLIMGISGCGKSLSVKAISALWNLPLFRLDMNQVYSGLHGTPEATFHRAVRTIETVAPAILWIDEIEGGISSSTMKDGSTGSHIFSAFLTWMQEKSSQIFVAATANRIDLLPAEILRKGRFDQVFFVDLPDDKEREDILQVHLRHHGADLSEFDLPFLSVATDSWNGAEIENVVKAAMIEAFYRNAAMTQDDLYTIIRSTVPLARTMSEQIKFIKNWASERAFSASDRSKD
jgi:AAA+ superfamily predicted ATPase